MQATTGYVNAFADAVARVNGRKTRGPEAAVLVMHPRVMIDLIQEMRASGDYEKLPVSRRPPNAFMGVVCMADTEVTEPFVLDVHGEKVFV